MDSASSIGTAWENVFKKRKPGAAVRRIKNNNRTSKQTDCKILRKVVVNRLKQHPTEKIHFRVQKFGISKRIIMNIITNHSRLRDKVFLGYFAWIDRKNVYGHLNQNYLFKTIEALGINRSFLKLKSYF